MTTEIRDNYGLTLRPVLDIRLSVRQPHSSPGQRRQTAFARGSGLAVSRGRALSLVAVSGVGA